MTVGTVLLVSFYDIEDHFRSGSFLEVTPLRQKG